MSAPAIPLTVAIMGKPEEEDHDLDPAPPLAGTPIRTPTREPSGETLVGFTALPPPEIAEYLAQVAVDAEHDDAEEEKRQRDRLESKEETGRIFIMEDEEEELADVYADHRREKMALMANGAAEVTGCHTPAPPPVKISAMSMACCSTQTTPRDASSQSPGRSDSLAVITPRPLATPRTRTNANKGGSGAWWWSAIVASLTLLLYLIQVLRRGRISRAPLPIQA